LLTCQHKNLCVSFFQSPWDIPQERGDGGTVEAKFRHADLDVSTWLSSTFFKGRNCVFSSPVFTPTSAWLCLTFPGYGRHHHLLPKRVHHSFEMHLCGRDQKVLTQVLRRATGCWGAGGEETDQLINAWTALSAPLCPPWLRAFTPEPEQKQ
jgi:hypothetical protein